MAHTDTRNVEQIRRDAERARADLTETVQQLRETVSDAASDVRQRFSAESIRDDIVATAARNPLQAAAVGALVAWPALRLARAIPLPVMMIGAGLFLTGTKSGKRLSRSVVDSAGDLADEARRKAHDVTDAATETASELTERATRMADQLRRQAEDTAHAATAAVSDAAGRAAALASDAVASSGAAADSLATGARESLDSAGRTMRTTHRSVAASADGVLDWAKSNPLVLAGVGMIVGGFVASALPPTETERSVVGAVSGAARSAARQGVNAAVGVATGAAVDLARRAAEQGLDPDRFREAAQDYGDRAMKVAEATVDAATGAPGDRTPTQSRAGE